MRLLFLILAGFLWLPPSARAVEVTYAGEKPADASSIKRRADQLESAEYTSDSIADSVMAWLHESGYLRAEARPDTKGVTVSAGDRFYLTELTVRTDTTYSVSTRAPFTEDVVGAAIDRVLARYRNSGHYYVRAEVDSAIASDSDIRLVLTVNPGPVLTVDRLRLEGLSRSDVSQLRKYLPVQSGQPISDRLLAEADEAARAVDYVTYVPPVTVETRPGFTQADLKFQFREKRQVSVFGGGGYIPDDETGLVWNLQLDLNNLFGRGRQVRLASARPEAERTTLSIRYAQPAFLLAVDRLSVDVATRDYRDNFYEFGLNTEYGSRLSRDFEVLLGLQARRVEPAGNLAGYSAYTAATSARREVLDNRVNPSRGLDVQTSLAYTYRRYSDDSTAVQPGRSSYNETRTRIAIGLYYPLLSRLIGHISLQYMGFETNQDSPPLSELYLIGGPGSLRGYRNEQFAAQRVGLASIEPRLRFTSGYLFLFYDAAYLNLPTSGSSSNAELYKDSYGFGFLLGDAARTVTLSLGWNDASGIDQPRLSVQFSSDI